MEPEGQPLLGAKSPAPVSTACLPGRPPAGLIFTAGAIWNVLQKLNVPIHVQEVSAPGGCLSVGWGWGCR